MQFIWQLYDNLGVDNIRIFGLSGQKGSDKKQVLFMWSPLPYFVLRTLIHCAKINHKMGLKIHSAAATSPPRYDMNEMRWMKKKIQCVARTLESTREEFSNHWTFLWKEYTFVQQKWVEYFGSQTPQLGGYIQRGIFQAFLPPQKRPFFSKGGPKYQNGGLAHFFEQPPFLTFLSLRL